MSPTLATFEKTDMNFARAYWHWFFLIQPTPFPETLILNNPEVLKTKFFWRRVCGERILH
jgi:haloacetate dehalogenase